MCERSFEGGKDARGVSLVSREGARAYPCWVSNSFFRSAEEAFAMFDQCAGVF